MEKEINIAKKRLKEVENINPSDPYIFLEDAEEVTFLKRYISYLEKEIGREDD